MRHDRRDARTDGDLARAGVGHRRLSPARRRRGAWAAAIPSFKARLALSDGSLALALFAYAAGAVIAMLLATALAGKFGTAKATRIAALLSAIALALPAFAGSLAALAGATFVLGLATGLLDVTMNAHASGVEGRWGAAIMSSFHAGFSAGGLAGAMLGATLARFGAPGMLGAAAAVALALLAWAWPGCARRQGRASRAGSRSPGPRRASALRHCRACSVCEGAMGRLDRSLISSTSSWPAYLQRSATPSPRRWSRGGLWATGRCGPKGARVWSAAARRSRPSGLRSR